MFEVANIMFEVANIIFEVANIILNDYSFSNSYIHCIHIPPNNCYLETHFFPVTM